MVTVPWDQPVSAHTIQKVLKASAIDVHDSNLSKLRILDFGCGNGRYMEIYANYINKDNIFGAEIDTDQVANVRTKGFQCVQLSPSKCELPHENGFFDVVFSSNVIEHIPHSLYLGYLSEISRVLRPGGRFVVGTPNYPIKRLYDMRKAIRNGFPKYYLFDDPTHCNRLSVFQLEKDLAELFVDIHLDPTYILFEERLPFLHKPNVRRNFKIFGDKIFGYCVKPMN